MIISEASASFEPSVCTTLVINWPATLVVFEELAIRSALVPFTVVWDAQRVRDLL